MHQIIIITINSTILEIGMLYLHASLRPTLFVPVNLHCVVALSHKRLCLRTIAFFCSSLCSFMISPKLLLVQPVCMLGKHAVKCSSVLLQSIRQRHISNDSHISTALDFARFVIKSHS